MTRITTTWPKTRIPQIETLSVCFQYESENRLYDLEAQVEKDGIDSYTCVNIVGAEEVSDQLWRCMAERAEDLAFERENQPRNRKTGCECIGDGEGLLTRASHERDCPLKLRGEEREAYNDLLRKEQRL